jgi:L-asparaginase
VTVFEQPGSAAPGHQAACDQPARDRTAGEQTAGDQPAPDRIEVLYLGGTLGMAKSPRGWRASADGIDTIESLLREAAPGATIQLRSPWPPRDSAQFTPWTWDDLVAEVNAAGQERAAVMVLQGTDTMAYTASLLALAATASGPVVVTGAQASLAGGGRGADDAARNLTLAARFGRESARGAWVAFGDRILPGFGVTKTTTLAPDGFQVPAPEFALAGKHDHGAAPLAGRLAALAGRPLRHRLSAFRVPLVAIYPGFGGRELARAGAACAGVVLEAYGAGTAPLDGTGVERAIRRLTVRGTVVVVTSRCQGGRVDLGRYATGRRLADAGAIDGQGLTSEAAGIAIRYLAAIGLDAAEIRSTLGASALTANHIEKE